MKWCYTIWFSVFACLVFPCCNKVIQDRPYPFVELRVEGDDENIWWDVTTGEWDVGTGNLTIEAEGYAFEHFQLQLDNIRDTGLVTTFTTQNIYYTDGLTFRPTAIESGHIKITQVDGKAVKGVFSIYLRNGRSRAGNKGVSGTFGIIFP